MSFWLSHVVAVSSNQVIGVEGKLPWHIPSDLKRFKQLTSGHIVLMGRKTYESIGKPLPNRLNIVLSRKNLNLSNGVLVFSDLDTVFRYCNEKLSEIWPKEIFCIGGSEIYALTLMHCKKIYLTTVHKNVANGDAFYPNSFLEGFNKISQEDFVDEGSSLSLSFCEWSR